MTEEAIIWNPSPKADDKSSVWQFFNIGFINNAKYGRCLFENCTKPVIKCTDNGTSGLWTHVVKQHNVIRPKKTSISKARDLNLKVKLLTLNQKQIYFY